jgi:Protein required for attachment to host cells
MKNTLIIVADLGTFKAYITDEDEMHSSPRLQLLESTENGEAHAKRGNTLTVMEGKSGKNHGQQAMSANASDGEQHNMHLEKRRRSVHGIAQQTRHWLARHEAARCFIAAPEEILEQVLSHLGPDRARVRKALPLDLTRVDKPGLVEHFYRDGLR